MRVKIIINKLKNISRKKFYLTLTFILFSLFLTILVSQFSSLYAINSFAAGSSSSLNHPVYLADFYEPGCQVAMTVIG